VCLRISIICNQKALEMKIHRPKTFADFQGKANKSVVERLKVAISASKKRNEPLGHILLFGPPGTGKTTIANIIANEMDSKLKTITGGTIQTQKDLWILLYDIYTAHDANINTILFIDECHRLARSDFPEETYLPLLEDFCFYHNLEGECKFRGQVFDIYSNVVKLKPFTIIGATTDPGMLSNAFRQRFQTSCFLKEYSVEDIQDIIRGYSKINKIVVNEDAITEIAIRSRMNPRVSINFLKSSHDLIIAKDKNEITRDIVTEEMDMQEVDINGLVEADYRILLTLANHPKGLGIKNLGGCCGIDKSTIEEIYEPYLKRKGYTETRNKRFITDNGLKLLIEKGLLTEREENGT